MTSLKRLTLLSLIAAVLTVSQTTAAFQTQVHVRTGMLAGKYTGLFSGEFNLTGAFDMDIEFFLSQTGSLLFRFISRFRLSRFAAVLYLCGNRRSLLFFRTRSLHRAGGEQRNRELTTDTTSLRRRRPGHVTSYREVLRSNRPGRRQHDRLWPECGSDLSAHTKFRARGTCRSNFWIWNVFDKCDRAH